VIYDRLEKVKFFIQLKTETLGTSAKYMVSQPLIVRNYKCYLTFNLSLGFSVKLYICLLLHCPLPYHKSSQTFQKLNSTIELWKNKQGRQIADANKTVS
jgi:hypothetical protein